MNINTGSDDRAGIDQTAQDMAGVQRKIISKVTEDAVIDALDLARYAIEELAAKTGETEQAVRERLYEQIRAFRAQAKEGDV